jgi:hypothetical protein
MVSTSKPIFFGVPHASATSFPGSWCPGFSLASLGPCRPR